MQDIKPLLTLWREDPGGTYQTWLLWKDRLRNFGAIRRGLGEVVREIEAGTFGSLYKAGGAKHGVDVEGFGGGLGAVRHLFVYVFEISYGLNLIGKQTNHLSDK